ncbi:MAG TPA: NAD(P)-dependent oxidoreductase [Stellaceae bacterium]|nr:NAD(P)-dependent oxidoreductase [Stellaceae bacterium]
MTSETIGYLGVGLMGAPMVRRLLAAGYPVAVWGRTPDKLAPVLAAGASPAEGPADTARRCSVLMLCLTDTKAVEHVIFGPGGAAEGLAPGSVVVDFSSIQPAATREIATRIARDHGVAWVDAPVSGGVPGAEQGTLAIMAGGTAEAVERVRPIVTHLANRFTHMGPSGAGQTTKLVNQVIAGCSFAVIAEAIRLAKEAGVDAARIPECLKGGFADSLPLQVFGPRMAAGEWNPALGYTYVLMKDLDTAKDLAREVGAPLPMASVAAELMRMLIARVGPLEEPSALVDLLGPPMRQTPMRQTK